MPPKDEAVAHRCIAASVRDEGGELLLAAAGVDVGIAALHAVMYGGAVRFDISRAFQTVTPPPPLPPAPK